MKGRTALVTGGASGLGRATALELAGRGVNVAIADRKVNEAEETAVKCRARGVTATAIEFNQANPESVEACIARAVSSHGTLDFLFANAGVGRFRSFLDMTPQEWGFLIDVNLNGTFYVCRAAAKAMISGGRGGAMVLTASSGAQVMCDQLSAYCSAKAGVVMLMKYIASELGPYRMRANAIMPGVVETQLSSHMLKEEKWRKMLERETPIGRWGQPDEIGKVVSFLLSDEAAYVNGEAIMLDGGSTLHAYPRWFSLDYSRENHQDWE
jgi:NAD(P)-dependent dehydrogenase (short-subunit alcohol dehydrogenase family)